MLLPAAQALRGDSRRPAPLRAAPPARRRGRPQLSFSAAAPPSASITLTAGPDDGAPAALMTWLTAKGLPLAAVEPGVGGGLVATRGVGVGEVRQN